ncbi:MAG: conjugal transfer protein [bacterium]|nr:conjugal transfer protein [bacterium]
MISSAPLSADAEGEREALARLVHELKALEPVIKQAEAQSPREARVRLRYDWLRTDLRRVAQGIQDHINAPRAEPRQVAPLRGDYRR